MANQRETSQETRTKHGKAQAKPKGKAKVKPVDPMEQIKMEIAEEIGLADKIRQVGWGGLSAAETGRIGGLINRRLVKPIQKESQRDSLK